MPASRAARTDRMPAEKIHFVDFREDWSRRYSDDAKLLAETLQHLVVRIHHVGSTAIRGIKSKPIIDINVEASTFPPDQAAITAMESLGYTHMGESGVPGRAWFKKGSPRQFNLHWCPEGSEVTRAQIEFRDRLNAHQRLADEYERLKIAAAPGQSIDSQAYAASKSSFIDKVLKMN